MKFKLISNLKPKGDQPEAIRKLTQNIKSGCSDQTLLGVTGSGKTATMSWTIEKTQKPALIISPNKTLCAQLYQEFRDFFPSNAVHYFVSYYDYYQPEAYIPQTDTYIEKDAKINEEIDRLRHSAVQDLITRKDIIICASVSCIYNLGSPDNYQQVSLEISRGQKIKRRVFISRLIDLQYQRSDNNFLPGNFRVRGNIIDVYPATGRGISRIEFLGDRISKICSSEKSSNIKSNSRTVKRKLIFPAHFWIAPQKKTDIATENIKLELQKRLKELKRAQKLLEARRLEQKTNYDLEMIKENGWCHGIENYSKHLEFRKQGQAPFALIDYFNRFNPNGFLVFIDESHITVPQLKAMAVQDKARKKILIEHGFRLPSAIDNRPLTLEEFEKKAKTKIYLSATPSFYEKKRSKGKITEQLIRPTGLLEPEIEIRPAKNQLENLVSEIKKRIKKNQRILVLTLTKRLAEAISEYLSERNIRNKWLHAEIKTLERPEILKNLRLGKFDVLVGINLLREGLDLPEVSLVAIMDADKEGFLRNQTTLIQIMGRAARNKEGRIILYADTITKSIKSAVSEIERRKKIQKEFNKKNNISPKPIVKEIKEWGFFLKKEEKPINKWQKKDKKYLEREMKKAAQNLNFEKAAKIRDLINKL